MGKVKRTMAPVGKAQQETEETNHDKFADTQSLAVKEKPVQQAISTSGRISPQISCTVLPEDRQLLNELTLYASNKSGRIVNTSNMIRALIRLGHKRKEELEF